MLASALLRVIGAVVRRTWLVTLLAILVCGMFAANGIAAYVEAKRPLALPAAPTAAVRRAEPPPREDPVRELERNIFCSSCEPAPPVAAGYTGHPAVLIATTLGGELARATVRVIPTQVQGSWALGETIPGVGRITRIGGASIEVVDRVGHEKQLSLREAAVASGAATPGPAASPTTTPGIAKLSDGSYQVSRDVVRQLVANGGRKAGARVRPVLKGGEVAGLRFYRVRRGSTASAIGLRSGDTLSAIDGTPIKTAQQLLDLYGKLDRLSGLELQGTRRGKPLAIRLRFR